MEPVEDSLAEIDSDRKEIARLFHFDIRSRREGRGS
jgi:hypothetical protein